MLRLRNMVGTKVGRYFARYDARYCGRYSGRYYLRGLPCPEVRSSRILSSWVGRYFGRYYLRGLTWQVAKARLSASSKRGSQQQQRQHASKPGSTPGSKLDSMPGSELDSKPGSELDCKRSSTLRCVVLDFCQAGSAIFLVDFI